MPPSEPANSKNPSGSPSEESRAGSVALDESPAPEHQAADPAPDSASAPPLNYSGSRSRYLDYDTHELLEKISEYEDERRWQRIREGIWISIIAHVLFFSILTWIPRYVFNAPQVIDPFDAIKQRKDLTYLDELPDAIKQAQKIKPQAPVLKPNQTHVDSKTLEAIRRQPKPTPPAPPPAPVPQPQVQSQQPPVQAPAPPSAAPPAPAPTIAQDIPRPAPVPAKPNFSLGPQNPADQLRQAMRNSAHSAGGAGTIVRGGSLNQHPGAAGGAEILSDTQGVDFSGYLQKLRVETYRTWDPLIPEEVNPPIYKRGEVEIIFSILPNGRIQPHSMTLTVRSGDVALDRAAWGAIEGADYPPLPREFHGPYLQLRFHFNYNVQ